MINFPKDPVETLQRQEKIRIKQLEEKIRRLESNGTADVKIELLRKELERLRRLQP